jgi:tetratricopeptide (TPR) repeat protein
VEKELSLFLSNGRPVEEPPGSLLAELAPLPLGDGEAGRQSRRALPLLVKWLIVRSDAVRFAEPDKMLHWALMARLAAESCTATEAGSSMRCADLQARAWAQLSASFRIKGLLRASEEAIGVAQQWSREGTGDPGLRSWILGAAACLSFEKGSFATAIELAGKAGRISGTIGEFNEQANRLVTVANAWSRAGDAERAIGILERAIARPEFRRNSEWLFIARHNLIDCCISAGRADKARTLFVRTQPKFRASSNSVIFLRSLWQHGELLALLGHLETAESALRRAHRGFLGMALPQDVALLCGRLVALNREMGRSKRGEQIVAESLTLLERHAEPETLASVRQLEGAP